MCSGLGYGSVRERPLDAAERVRQIDIELVVAHQRVDMLMRERDTLAPPLPPHANVAVKDAQ